MARHFVYIVSTDLSNVLPKVCTCLYLVPVYVSRIFCSIHSSNNPFRMVKMASGMDHGRPTTSHNMAAIQLIPGGGGYSLIRASWGRVRVWPA